MTKNTKGYAAIGAKEKLVPYEFDRRELGAHDVALDVLYAGISRGMGPCSLSYGARA
jgi:D-arabinose 1-dehydrogenase-like Zn-dependent alcohol dehydrogenase